VQHSKQSGVLPCRRHDLADSELTRRLLQRFSGGIDAQVVRRPRYTELPRRFESPRRFEPPRRSEPAASASSFVA